MNTGAAVKIVFIFPLAYARGFFFPNRTNINVSFLISPDEGTTGMTLLNVGLLGENICLAALELGLGTCFMAGPSMFLTTNEKAKPYLDKLGFSEGYKLRYVIGVGYPDETPAAKPRDLSKIKFVD